MNISIFLKKTVELLKIVLEGEDLGKSGPGTRDKQKGFISYLISSENLEPSKDMKNIGGVTSRPKGILSTLMEREELTSSATGSAPVNKGFFAWLLEKENIDENKAEEKTVKKKK